jgi:hypothetical protein
MAWSRATSALALLGKTTKIGAAAEIGACGVMAAAEVAGLALQAVRSGRLSAVPASRARRAKPPRPARWLRSALVGVVTGLVAHTDRAGYGRIR